MRIYLNNEARISQFSGEMSRMSDAEQLCESFKSFVTSLEREAKTLKCITNLRTEPTPETQSALQGIDKKSKEVESKLDDLDAFLDSE